MIRKVLVANRGEIAVRIARGCRELGITSVLAHAADESDSMPSRFFDETISLGEGESRETYLAIPRIIDAARKTGADAIHPGYGFLSERAELAAACRDAGIIFVGPSPESIEAMGSKAGARALMEKLGVPVVPGYHGKDQSHERLLKEGERIGFPLLVKASAGGGGKGMKVVRDGSQLKGAIESAQREAEKAFGNADLLLEKYIEEPRHVEFQVFGDSQGNIIHLYERDCSVQRRHQKVIEETPAPRYSEELRQRMAESAIAAARGVSYVNAGTVEFIVTPQGDYYFLEMNTRLQVEHPVTESVVGVDLVDAQLRVASGQPLPWKQEELRQRGHSIQCRIYAEDADNGYLPQTGTVGAYREPAGPGVRVDSGIAIGSEVTIKYDPLLAKLIVSAETRDLCIERLIRALGEYVILGTKTNVSFLRRVVAHPRFRKGEATTAFLTENESELRREPSQTEAAVAALIAANRKRSAAASPSNSSTVSIPSIWSELGQWGR